MISDSSSIDPMICLVELSHKITVFFLNAGSLPPPTVLELSKKFVSKKEYGNEVQEPKAKMLLLSNCSTIEIPPQLLQFTMSDASFSSNDPFFGDF